MQVFMVIPSCNKKLSSLESMYVTPDLSGVRKEILGAAAQLLGAKIEIPGVAAQPLAWWRAVVHKKENFGLALAYIVAPQDMSSTLV